MAVCAAAFVTAAAGFAQDTHLVPKADKPVLLLDRAMIESVQGEQSFRMIGPRLVPEAEPAAPAVQFPTVLRDGDRWLFYGCVPSGPQSGTLERAAVLHATNSDGVTWQTGTETGLKIPARVESGFTPLVDTRPDASEGERFKALARASGGGLLALASGDGKTWTLVSDGPVLTSDANDAFYGRNSVFWSEADGVYLGFVSELRDGKRVISRVTSKDFRSWTRPAPLELNAEGEEIWSATVFPVVTRPPLLLAMLTRTAAGKTGPADICLATSRDGGRTFERRFLEAWVRPESGAKTWQAMVPSPAVGFVRPEPWFGIDEMVFYAGGRRYESFANRFIACTAPAFEPGPPGDEPKPPNPTVIATRPFVVTGNTVELNFRAPHIYIGLPTRIDFNHNAATEVLLTSSRDGVHFDRRFTEPFLRPGVRVNRYYPYGNRGNYAAHQVIQTGPSELSLYTYDGRRFTLRLDGFASLNAPFAGGEMVTRPLTFTGENLEINARTAGIGSVRVEIQDAGGQPIPGYTLAECEPFVGDCVAHVVKWRGGADVSKLAGQPIRLRPAMKDADLFSLRFAPSNPHTEPGQ